MKRNETIDIIRILASFCSRVRTIRADTIYQAFACFHYYGNNSRNLADYKEQGKMADIQVKGTFNIGSIREVIVVDKAAPIKKVIHTMSEQRFMFEELVKRDFKQKYKRTVLGMGWSVLSPLLTLLVMRLVFTQFFGRNIEHYTTYLFAGNLMFSYFKESTNGGMQSLMANSNIITKINVPKYMFLFSKCLSAVINFALTLIVFFIFVDIDQVPFRISMIGIIYPIVTLTMFNVGLGMILSAMFVFFRDTQYLYDVFTLLLMYMSAIFYNVDGYPGWVQRIFLINPVYCNIKYVRVAVLDGHLPSPAFHGLLLLYGVVAILIGGAIYKKYNQKFLYYM